MKQDVITVRGGIPLRGEVKISGMKNAALPILFATILIPHPITLHNIPEVSDVNTTLRILSEMGAEVTQNGTDVTINTANLSGGCAPDELVRKMRGSSYLLGAELGRFGESKIAFPGGCDFGKRPMDLHMKGFRTLGAETTENDSFLSARAWNGLIGSTIYFDFASVGATANLMLASVFVSGTTVIDNAAREPHIVDLANFLNTCGADIVGAGTSAIKVHGVKKDSLHGCEYTIIPDMIEAGTFMVASAVTGGTVKVSSIIPKHVESISQKLTEIGYTVIEEEESVTVSGKKNAENVNVKTVCYPGFPTDMHPQFAVLQCVTEGYGTVHEGVFPGRFRYIDELKKMGGAIVLEGATATFIGVRRLKGANVTATDLRAGAAMVLAGLNAEGETVISNAKYIDRGYDHFVEKLKSLGADIALQ